MVIYNRKYRNQIDHNIPSTGKAQAEEARSGKFGAENWKDQGSQSWQYVYDLVTVQAEGLQQLWALSLLWPRIPLTEKENSTVSQLKYPSDLIPCVPTLSDQKLASCQALYGYQEKT